MVTYQGKKSELLQRHYIVYFQYQNTQVRTQLYNTIVSMFPQKETCVFTVHYFLSRVEEMYIRLDFVCVKETSVQVTLT